MTKNKSNFLQEVFPCPHCKAISQHKWFGYAQANQTILSLISGLYYKHRIGITDYQQNAVKAFLDQIQSQLGHNFKHYFHQTLQIGSCSACKKYSLWVNGEMVFPRSSIVSPPNTDLTEKIKALYTEASLILLDSPKGAAAILRLALQKLLKEVGKKGENINNDIKELVAEGLSPKIQQALDLLRVIGNNAVHPGEINLDDNEDIALRLFQIINFIAEELITKPKELNSLYQGLMPERDKQAIKKRDGKKAT